MVKIIDSYWQYPRSLLQSSPVELSLQVNRRGGLPLIITTLGDIFRSDITLTTGKMIGHNHDEFFQKQKNRQISDLN